MKHRAEQNTLPILWESQISCKSQLRDVGQSRGDEEWVKNKETAK